MNSNYPMTVCAIVPTEGGEAIRLRVLPRKCTFRFETNSVFSCAQFFNRRFFSKHQITTVYNFGSAVRISIFLLYAHSSVKMADSVLREIIGDLVKVLIENPQPAVENLLAASADRKLKCLRGEALIRRIKALLGHIPIKNTLKLYNCGKFSGSFEVLRIVCAVVSKSSVRSSRDAVALRTEVQQLGK